MNKRACRRFVWVMLVAGCGGSTVPALTASTDSVDASTPSNIAAAAPSSETPIQPPPTAIPESLAECPQTSEVPNVDAGALRDGDVREGGLRDGPVNGRLEPSEIQRVVRSNFGAFKHCYEAELAKNPRLSGRVRMRFVIDRTGAVSSTADLTCGPGGLHNSRARACIQAAFANLQFPIPDDGIVTVVYPIDFAPGN